MRLSTPPGSCRSRMYCESLTTFIQLTSFMLLCVSSGWLSASMQSSSNVSSLVGDPMSMFRMLCGMDCSTGFFRRLFGPQSLSVRELVG